MGASGQQGAVVDVAGRVHGVSALRVVDASIFPTIPNGNLVVVAAAAAAAAAVVAVVVVLASLLSTTTTTMTTTN